MTGPDRLIAELIRRRGEGRGMICIVMGAGTEACFTDQLRVYVSSFLLDHKLPHKARKTDQVRALVYPNILSGQPH